MSEENNEIKVAPSRPGAPQRPSAPVRPGPVPQRPGAPVSGSNPPVSPQRPTAPTAPVRPSAAVPPKPVQPVQPTAPQRPQPVEEPKVAPTVVQKPAEPVQPVQPTPTVQKKEEPKVEENIANKIVRLGTTPSINLCSKKGTDNIDPQYKDTLQQAYIELEKGEFGAASGHFESILSQVKYPVAIIGNILAISGAKSIDVFHAEHAHNFTNYSMVKEFLDSSVRLDDAVTVLNVFCEGAKLLINYKQTAQFTKCYLAFCDYNDQSVKKLHRVAYDYAIACIKAKTDIEEAEKILKASVLRMCNNRPYSYYMAFIQYIIGAYVTTQNFEKAAYWKDQLLAQDEKDLYANWATLKVEYKTAHDHELFEAIEKANQYERVAHILETIRQEDLEKLVSTIHKRMVVLLDVDSTAKDPILNWVNVLNRHRYKLRDQCIAEDLSLLMKTNHPAEMEPVFNSILEKSNRSDVNTYTENMFLYANNALSKEGGMPVAEKWFTNINRVDRTNYRGYLGKIYCKLGCKGIDRLYKFMPDFTLYQDVDTMLKAANPKTPRTEILSTFISACIMYIVNSESETDVYDITPEDGIFEAFAHFLDRIPQEEYGDDKSINIYIKKMGEACFERGLYDQATMYFEKYIETDKNDHEIYWAIVQSKLRSDSDEAMVAQDTSIKSVPEYSLAVSNASKHDAERYKDVAERQEKRISAAKKASGKKKSKRAAIISVVAILVIIAVVGGVFGGLYMVRNGQEGFDYSLDASGNGYVVSAQKYFKDTIVTIPRTYDGKPITEIGSFAGKDIKEFYMPSTVTVIQASAFAGCENLTKVLYLEDKDDDVSESLDSPKPLNAVSVVTSQVRKIEDHAFNGCKSLTTIFDFSPALAEIGNNAFDGCTSLTSITIPASVSSMGAGAFANCSPTLEIVLPNRQTAPNWPEGWNGASQEEYECLVQYQFDVKDTSGSTVKSQRVLYGKAFTLLVPKEDAKPGYTFAGWYSAEIGGTKYTDENGVGIGTWGVMGSRKIFAQWTPKQNNLVFYSNGGSGDMETLKVNTAAVINLPANTFTRTGYSFAGWATTASGNVAYADEAEFVMPTDSTVALYAIWEASTNELRFNANGGTGTMDSMFIAATRSANITSCTFTRNGYRFLGWSTTPNGEVQYANGASYTMGEESLYILYAIWGYDTYTITYELNGGTNAENNPTSYLMISDTLPLNTPTRLGYDFGGWYTTSTFTASSRIDSIAHGSYGNKTLYAKWNIHEYSISYSFNEGTKVDPDSAYPRVYTIESDITLGSLARTGYRFLGWFAGSVQITRIYQRTGDLVNLTARFEEQEYSITYNLHGGTNSANNPSGYYMSSEAITIEAPSREGYTFLGWLGTNIVGDPRTTITIVSGSVGDRAYEACWQVNVTYHANDGSTGTDKVRTTYTGASYTLEANDFVNISYTFVGWATSPSGDIVYHDGATLTVQDDHIDLYAKWVGAFNFAATQDGTGWIIVGLARTKDTIVVPELFDGKPIVGMASNVFKNNTTITSIEIVSRSADFNIGDFAFYGCTKLTTVTFPANVTSIGKGIFAYCNKLTTINFVGNDKYEVANGSIVDKNYDGNGNKAVIAGTNSSRIPTDVKIVASYAFYRLTVKSTLVFNNTYGTSVETIEENAFYGCTAIQSLEITKNIEYIGQYAFANMVNLKTLTFATDGTEDLTIDSYAFYNCYSLKSLTVPARLTELAPYAFASCYSITSIAADDGGTYLTTTTLGDHKALLKKNAEGDNYTLVLGCSETAWFNDVDIIGEGAFYLMTNGASKIKLTFRNSLREIGDYAFYGCSFQSTNPNTNLVTTIGEGAFAETNITSILIQANVTTIGEGAFNSCLSLSAINCKAASQPSGWNSAWYGDCDPSIIVFGHQD